MIEDRIQKLESRVRQAGGIPEATKNELLDLISALKAELPANVATAAPSESESSLTEADHGKQEPELLQSAVEELTRSVEELEASHPTAVQVANRIALILSNMGM